MDELGCIKHTNLLHWGAFPESIVSQLWSEVPSLSAQFMSQCFPKQSFQLTLANSIAKLCGLNDSSRPVVRGIVSILHHIWM